MLTPFAYGVGVVLLLMLLLLACFVSKTRIFSVFFGCMLELLFSRCSVPMLSAVTHAHACTLFDFFCPFLLVRFEFKASMVQP